MQRSRDIAVAVFQFLKWLADVTLNGVFCNIKQVVKILILIEVIILDVQVLF